MGLFQGSSFNLLEKSLDVSALRQKVIANNIANIDTPNFKRSEVRFEQLLRNEMSSLHLEGFRTNNKHIPIGKATTSKVDSTIYTDQKTAMNNNQNNVDIDAEMSLMAKNQLSYNVLIQQLNHNLQLTRTAIGGR